MSVGGRECFAEYRTLSNDLLRRENAVHHHLLQVFLRYIGRRPLALETFSLFRHGCELGDAICFGNGREWMGD